MPPERLHPLEVSWEALEDAGVVPSSLSGTERIAVRPIRCLYSGAFGKVRLETPMR